MYLAYSHSVQDAFRRLLGGVLIAALIFMSSPLSIVLAESDAGEAGAEQQSQEESGEEGSEALSDGQDGGDGQDGEPQSENDEEQQEAGPEEDGAEGDDGEEGVDAGEQSFEEGDGEKGGEGESAEEGAEGDEGESGDGGEGGEGDEDGEPGTKTPDKDEPAEDGEPGEGGDDQADANEENGEAQAGDGEEGDDGKSTTHSEDGEHDSASGEGDEEDQNATSTRQTDGEPAEVDTGDASSSGSVGTGANISNTSASSSASTTDTEVDTDNDLAATSTATSTAHSGGNAASDPDGAAITTGQSDAFGFLVSLFNIVITNSLGSLLFLQNPLGPELNLTDRFTDIFGDRDRNTVGDCTFERCDGERDERLRIHTENVANISNELIVRSNSGDNDAASSQGEASVETGDARSMGSIINFGNLQLINSRYLIILLANEGDLEGDIVVPPPSFFKKLSSSVGVVPGSSTTANATSVADIINEGTTNALSGDNHATGTQGASVDTGNADSGAFVLNDVNGNYLGGRPICFIVSVGGEWRGDVVGLPEGFDRESTPFGELICGAGGAAPSPALPDEFVADTDNYAKILNKALIEAKTGGNAAQGLSADIKTGNAEAFLQILNIVNQNIVGADWIFALFTISGDWDGDLTFGSKAFWDDVNDRIRSMRARSSGGSEALRLEDSKLMLEKNVISDGEVLPGDTVTYEIVIENRGGPAYHSVLFDVIRDDDGEPIHKQAWELDTIQEQEDITVRYDVTFASTTQPGIYTNDAVIMAVENHPSLTQYLGKDVRSPVVSATVEVVAPPQEDETAEAIAEVFDPEAPQCGKYLLEYIKYGEENNPVEVAKLQTFLIDHGYDDMRVTGRYDEATYEAVHQFQEDFGEEVLEPWGIEESTGYVYYTTQKKINDLYCEEQRIFELTPLQKREIDDYRDRLESLRALDDVEPEDLPDTSEVGFEGSAEPALARAGDPGLEDDDADEAPGDTVGAAQAAAAANANEIQERGQRLMDQIMERVADFMSWLSRGIEKVKSIASR